MSEHPRCWSCGHTDLSGGVCPSPMGAASFHYCAICLALGAEDKATCEYMSEGDDSIGWIAYDHTRDVYVNQRGENVPLALKDGRTFANRTDLAAAVKRPDTEPS